MMQLFVFFQDFFNTSSGELWNEICECKALIWRIWLGHKLTWGQGWLPLYPTNHHVLLSDCKSSQGLRGDSHEVLRIFAQLVLSIIAVYGTLVAQNN